MILHPIPSCTSDHFSVRGSRHCFLRPHCVSSQWNEENACPASSSSYSSSSSSCQGTICKISLAAACHTHISLSLFTCLFHIISKEQQWHMYHRLVWFIANVCVINLCNLVIWKYERYSIFLGFFLPFFFLDLYPTSFSFDYIFLCVSLLMPLYISHLFIGMSINMRFNINIGCGHIYVELFYRFKRFLIAPESN